MKLNIPARIEMGFLAMFGFINLYMTRVNLSVISVGMIKKNVTSSPGQISIHCSSMYANTAVHSYNNSTADQANATAVIQTGDLDWDEYQKGQVFASFYYGYTLTQIIGGRLAELYGCKIVLLLAIGPCGILTILSPVVARQSYEAFVALRILIGLLQGPAFPAMHALCTRWIPQLERSRFFATVSMSTCIGIIITMPMCGKILDLWGWDAAFYITGCLPLIWAALWIVFARDDPKDHPRISTEELSYIKLALEDGGTDVIKVEKPIVPWKAILTSPRVWAIILCAIGNSWGLALFLTYLPSYLKNVLNFSIASSGFLSGLPFIMRYLGALLFSSSSDYIIGRGYITLNCGRRLFSIISMIGPAIMVFVVTLFACNSIVVVASICAALFMNGAITAGYFVNHTDLSPIYSGTLMGIENTFGSIVSFLNPVLIGLILNQKNSLEQWRIVFIVCVPIYLFCEIAFLCLMSTNIQPWNYACKPAKNDEEATQNILQEESAD